MVDYVLVFKGPLIALFSYSDFNWVKDHNTQKSTLGYVFNVGNAVISWSLKLQLTVILLLCEAKYIGQTNTTKKAIWLQ